MYLLYHRMNRKNPERRAVDEVTVDVDEDEEEGECFVSPNFRRDDYQDKPDAQDAQDAEKSDKGTSGSNQQDSPVDGGTGVQPTPASLLDDHHDDDCSPHSSTAKTPTVRHGKRRTAPANKFSSSISFEERKFLSPEECNEIYQLIRAECNDLLVLNVGGTTMTGGELVKCLEEGDSALSIINAFIQCLKYDDQNKCYNKERIIIPPQDLVFGCQLKALSDSKIFSSADRRRSCARDCERGC